VHATPAVDPHCPGGKEVSADTAGHCCWPGQVWGQGSCVGVPTSCPSNLILNANGQSCDLPHCQTGQIRAQDGINCCWAGQAWSRTRSICVGVPKCPKGMEIEGEDHCVSLDKDGDGIPNAVDKCPDQPEDFNHYKDEDGCPDEPERLAMVEAQQQAAIGAAAAAAAKAEAERKAAALKAAQELAAKQAAEALAARQREADAAAVEEHKAWEENMRARSRRRTVGYVFVGAGVVGGVLTGVFAATGGGENSSIAKGGFATGADIASAASTGQTYNTVSEVMLGVGIVGLGVGLPLILASLPTAEPGPAPRVTVNVTPTSNGAMLVGRF
jgi:hypothetical protein